MTEKVIRFSDYERKSREADCVAPRDPADAATIIILPSVPIEHRTTDNEMILSRMWGAPARPSTPEDDRDPRNPNVRSGN